jgi:hypothetical protein
MKRAAIAGAGVMLLLLAGLAYWMHKPKEAEEAPVQEGADGRACTLTTSIQYRKTIDHNTPDRTGTSVRHYRESLRAFSTAQCTFSWDDSQAPELHIMPVEGKKPIANAVATLTDYSLETQDNPNDRIRLLVTVNAHGNLDPSTVPPLGFGAPELNYDWDPDDQLDVSGGLSVAVTGKKHQADDAVFLTYMDAMNHRGPEHEQERPPDTDFSASVATPGIVYPLASKGKNSHDPSGDGWYGAQTTKTKNGGIRVSYSGTRSSNNGEDTTVEEFSMTSELTPGKPVDADLEISAADANAYDRYIPLPVSDDAAVTKLFGNGETLTFTATVKAKDPKKGAPAGVIDFYLVDVPRHKGLTGNYPKSGEEHDGLEFAPGGDAVIDPRDPKHAYTSRAMTGASVRVKANETGAYGRLIARSADLGLEAVDTRTHSNGIDIPRDDDQNHIADAWEQQNGIYEKKLPPTWDEEETPEGKNKGDGLTLYEEYRGFVVANANPDGTLAEPAFQRMRPGVKKVFLYPFGADAKLYVAGIRQFAQASGLQVYFIGNINHLMDDRDDPIFPAWLNFNSTTNDGVDFGPVQHAVIVVDRPSTGSVDRKATTGNAEPITQGDQGPYTPNDVKFVAVYRAHIEQAIKDMLTLYANLPKYPESSKWASDRGMKATDFQAILNDPQQVKHLVDEWIEFVVVHELGHAVGAEHHGIEQMRADQKANGGENQNGKSDESYFATGDPACPMFYWNNGEPAIQMPFVTGKWDPSSSSWIPASKVPDMGTPSPWKFCSIDQKKIRLHQ